MAIKIKSVAITPSRLNVSEPFTITVAAEEATWGSLNNELQSWGEVRRSFTNWNKVKDFIYTIPNPTADSNCLYDSNGRALFDIDAVQISVTGSATLQHTGEEIDQFLREVNNS